MNEFIAGVLTMWLVRFLYDEINRAIKIRRFIKSHKQAMNNIRTILQEKGVELPAEYRI